MSEIVQSKPQLDWGVYVVNGRSGASRNCDLTRANGSPGVSMDHGSSPTMRTRTSFVTAFSRQG